MGSKIFLDANFLLDLTLQRAGFRTANEIMELGIGGTVEMFTSPSVLHITAYFTSQAYTARQTKEIILTLLNDVQVIDADHATVLTALSSNMADTEDALQYYTAVKSGIDYFISSDKKLKKSAIPQLPVITPAELLIELRQE